MGGASGITSDAIGGLGIAGGGLLSLLPGGAAIGIPLMTMGAGSLLGGNLGGWKGLGIGGGSGLAAGLGGEGLAGMGPLSGLLGGAGSSLAGLLGMGGSAGAAGAAATAPPTALGSIAQSVGASTLLPSGGGALDAPMTSGLLSSEGGGAGVGADAAGADPIAAPPLGGQTGGGPGQYYFNGTQWVQNPASTDQPWYKNPAYWQGAGTVGAEYLKYLAGSDKTEFAHPFSSTVVPQTGQLAALGQRGPVPPVLPPQLNI